MKEILRCHIRQQLRTVQFWYTVILTVLIGQYCIGIFWGLKGAVPVIGGIALVGYVVLWLLPMIFWPVIRGYRKIAKMLAAQGWDEEELSRQVIQYQSEPEESKAADKNILLCPNWFIVMYALAIRKDNIVNIRFIKKYWPASRSVWTKYRHKWEITCRNTPKRKYTFTTSVDCPRNAFESWLWG